ncbi:universal stress protein [Flavobacteriaceae bacterium F89]|uniref:Universal stress protein n=1 Tax=Cerina litoralis TaxID=2874477 RepID=A0AAE3EVU9_9FLAO|nr:universal stress protein [Cerina litoralis]MCG2461154.1 universal stress protein [Cerina litoralis]
MKHIIIPTDFSENAYNAIRYAIQLFKNIPATFHLLHTYTPPIFQVEYVFQSPHQDSLGDPYQIEAIKQLEALRKRLQEEFENPEHNITIRAAFNTLTDEIQKISDYVKADLVIMGTQGATNAREILFGTNATQVINKTTCPLIAVPSGFEYVAPKSILFPTDYEVGYKKEQLQQLLDITKMHGSSIDVLHISSGYDLTDEQSQNKQKLQVILAQSELIFNDLPDNGVIEAINQFQTKKTMSFLVMVRNKHTFFERMFVEPVIKKIGLQIDIPFMVIPYVDK